MELKVKLSTLWKILNIDIDHIGKIFYHVFLRNNGRQSMVMSMETQNLKPGIPGSLDGIRITITITKSKQILNIGCVFVTIPRSIEEW